MGRPGEVAVRKDDAVDGAQGLGRSRDDLLAYPLETQRHRPAPLPQDPGDRWSQHPDPEVRGDDPELALSRPGVGVRPACEDLLHHRQRAGRPGQQVGRQRGEVVPVARTHQELVTEVPAESREVPLTVCWLSRSRAAARVTLRSWRRASSDTRRFRSRFARLTPGLALLLIGAIYTRYRQWCIPQMVLRTSSCSKTNVRHVAEQKPAGVGHTAGFIVCKKLRVTAEN